MIIWNILRPFVIINGLLVWLVGIWYIFPVLVCLVQEKSVNPDRDGAPFELVNLFSTTVLMHSSRVEKFVCR
jgi:hypothetical protein